MSEPIKRHKISLEMLIYTYFCKFLQSHTIRSQLIEFAIAKNLYLHTKTTFLPFPVMKIEQDTDLEAAVLNFKMAIKVAT